MNGLTIVLIALQCYYYTACSGRSLEEGDVPDWSSFASISDALDLDDAEWNTLRQQIGDDEIQKVLDSITARQMGKRARRDVDEDKEKRLPRLGIRSTSEEKVEKEKRSPSLEDENRDKRFPRMGKRSPLPRVGKREDATEDKEKRLPRYGRASPFPRMGRATPYPRMGRATPYSRMQGRASPFPRMGRASPFPRMGRASPFPRMGRASPFPRMGRAAAYPGLGLDDSYNWIDEAEYADDSEAALPRIGERAFPMPRLG